MKILFLTPRLPHPRVLSGHVVVYQRVRRLVERGHTVSLCCFGNDEDLSHSCELSGQLADIQIVPSPSPGPLGSYARLRSLVSPGAPFGTWWRSREMLRRVGDLVARDQVDVAVAEFAEMGPFLFENPYLPAVRSVVSIHQSPTVASQKRIDLLGYSLAGLWERKHRDNLRQYEFRMYRAFDRVLVLTPQERFQLLNYQPDLRVSVVPCGVDTGYFSGRRPGVQPDGIVYTGYYFHEPNRDAVRWFSSEVWPRVRSHFPGLHFYVVGPGLPAEFHELARRDPSIIITGEVPDVREYLDRAYVFVCPVRMGSGMRVKILEAMAYGIPVVSTTLGAEGVPVQPSANCFTADDPEIMAQQIRLLIEDETVRTEVGRNAQAMVQERLSWDRSVEMMETVLAEVVARRG